MFLGRYQGLDERVHIHTQQVPLLGSLVTCILRGTNQGEQQIELLGKMATTLENIHLGQAEQSGFFKAQMLSKSRARAKK